MSEYIMSSVNGGWKNTGTLTTGKNDLAKDPIFGLQVGGNCQLDAMGTKDANETLNALGFVRQNVDGASQYVHTGMGLKFELEYLPKKCRFVTRIS